MEDFEGAESAYKKILNLDPDSKTVRTNYGILLDRIGRSDEALIQYRLTGEDYYRGRALQLVSLYYMKKYEEMLFRAKRFMEDGRIHFAANRAMTRWNLMQGRIGDALDLVERKAEGAPRNVEMLSEWAGVLTLAGA